MERVLQSGELAPKKGALCLKLAGTFTEQMLKEFCAALSLQPGALTRADVLRQMEPLMTTQPAPSVRCEED